MPTLPTFTVPDAVAARLMKAFEGQTDETGAVLPPAEAYKRWLRGSLVSLVTDVESNASREALKKDIQ